MLQKIADYDDTALGTGTLTVHPWRAGPDCRKIIIIHSGNFFMYNVFMSRHSLHIADAYMFNFNVLLN